VSQIFTLLGAGCSAACVAARAPELLMVGRVLVGVNSGQSSLNVACVRLDTHLASVLVIITKYTCAALPANKNDDLFHTDAAIHSSLEKYK